MKFLFTAPFDQTRFYCVKCLPSCELEHIYNTKISQCPTCSNELDDLELVFVMNTILNSRQIHHLLKRLFIYNTTTGITPSSLRNNLTNEALTALLELLIEDLSHTVFGYVEKSPNVFIKQEKYLFNIVHVTPTHITYIFTKNNQTISHKVVHSEQKLLEVFSLNDIV